MSARFRLNWRDVRHVAEVAAPFVAGAILDAATGGSLAVKTVAIGILLKVCQQFAQHKPECEPSETPKVAPTEDSDKWRA